MTSVVATKNMFNVLANEEDDHVKSIKYKISPSYQKRNSNSLPGHATLFVPNERTKGFTKLANKEDVSKSLHGTKPCRNVLRANGEKEYGICMRDSCTFAHSLSEFRLPNCVFGDDCKRKYGSKDKLGKIDKTNKCLFFHPRENMEQYYNRTGLVKPDLPEKGELNIEEPIVEKICTTTKVKVPKEHAQKFIDLLLELELYDHEIDTF